MRGTNLLATALAAALPFGFAGQAGATVGLSAPTAPASAAQELNDELVLQQPDDVYDANGCTVTADAPFKIGETSTGRNIARFRISFSCAGGRSLEVAHTGYDSDAGENSADDKLFSTGHGPYTVPTAGGTGSWYRDVVVAHWDGLRDPYVELVHWVRVEVTSNNGVGSGWSQSFPSSTSKFPV